MEPLNEPGLAKYAMHADYRWHAWRIHLRI